MASRSTAVRIERLDGRDAEPADIEAIARLQQRAFGEEYGQADVVDLELVEHTEALVARRERELVGVLLLVRPGAPRYWFERIAPIGAPCFPPELTRSNVSEGDGLVVLPSLRGRGLASVLTMLGAFVALDFGAEFMVVLHSPTSKRIVDQIGYVALGVSVRLGVHDECLVLARVPAQCDMVADRLRARLRSKDIELDASLCRLLDAHRG